jgi:hypothetical protein
MTDDLVKRLREEIVLERLSFGCVSMRRNPDGLEAADRIEQLEIYLAEAQRCLDVKDYEGAIIICRAAIGEKKDD